MEECKENKLDLKKIYKLLFFDRKFNETINKYQEFTLSIIQENTIYTKNEIEWKN